MLSAVAAFVLAAPAPRSVALLDLTSLKPGAEATLASRQERWDALHAASALQGLVNRKRPELYVLFVGDRARLDQYWLKRLQSTWLKNRTERLASLDDAIRRFRRSVNGVVVWDQRVPATSNVASTIAGVENLLPVRFDPARSSLYWRLTQDPAGPRLPVRRSLMRADGSPLFTGHGTIPDTPLTSTGSAKNDAYLWAAEKYLRVGKCAPGWMGYYPDAFWLSTPREVPLERTLLTNHDFFVAKKGFFFDLGPWEDEAPDDDLKQVPGTDGRTLRRLLHYAYRHNGGRMTHISGFTPWDQKYTDFTGRRRGGVDTEWHYAEVLSCFNAFMDADAPGLHAMANASVYMHEPLRARYPQTNRPSDADLVRRGYLRADGTVVPKRYAAIYAGDYDAAAWLYTVMPEVWDDPARGSVPIGWAFNPVLAERFPTGLAYARETATKNDHFISGDSGAGYLNPGYLEAPRKHSGLPSGLREWERFNAPRFRKWDLTVTGFVIDGYAPPMNDATKAAYARFSPDGVVAQKIPPLSMVSGTPFLRMGSDLPRHNVTEARRLVLASTQGEGVTFSIFRTILWTPKDHREMMDAVRSAEPRIEFVDPHTLTRLAKLAQVEASSQPKRAR